MYAKLQNSYQFTCLKHVPILEPNICRTTTVVPAQTVFQTKPTCAEEVAKFVQNTDVNQDQVMHNINYWFKKSLLAQHFSQKDKIQVVFGYLANDHGHF